MSDQASHIWSKQVKTTNANPHKTIHIPHSFERRHFFVISVFFCWCVIVCAIFFCWCADIPAAERDMSVFSLWDGIRSWIVKRQMLQGHQCKIPETKIWKYFSSANQPYTDRSWPKRRWRKRWQGYELISGSVSSSQRKFMYAHQICRRKKRV